MNADTFKTGILPEIHYRFVTGAIDEVMRHIAVQHGATPSMARLMGELMLGAFFLSTHAAKQDLATVSIHLECGEPVTRLIAFASSNGGIRSHTIHPRSHVQEERESLLENGILRVNRWINKTEKVYSSATTTRRISLEKNLEEFVSSSEQIQSFLHLQSRGETVEDLHISGYLFQALPGAGVADTETILSLLHSMEFLPFLNRLSDTDSNRIQYGMENASLTIQILSRGQFYHFCDCSQDKVNNLVRSMGKKGARELIRSNGTIETVCEFCKKKYSVNEADLVTIFSEAE